MPARLVVAAAPLHIAWVCVCGATCHVNHLSVSQNPAVPGLQLIVEAVGRDAVRQQCGCDVDTVVRWSQEAGADHPRTLSRFFTGEAGRRGGEGMEGERRDRRKGRGEGREGASTRGRMQ